MDHIHVKAPEESVTDVKRWFKSELSRLWPIALGSLTRRRSPCVRERCGACERGEQHPSYVLYGLRKPRRSAVYIPDDLAAEIEQALENGRQLQALLYEAGARYAKAAKLERTRRRGSARKRLVVSTGRSPSR